MTKIQDRTNNVLYNLNKYAYWDHFPKIQYEMHNVMGRYYPNVQSTKCRLPQLAWKDLTDREDMSLKANIIPVRINPRMEIILTGHHYQIS